MAVPANGSPEIPACSMEVCSSTIETEMEVETDLESKTVVLTGEEAVAAAGSTTQTLRSAKMELGAENRSGKATVETAASQCDAPLSARGDSSRAQIRFGVLKPGIECEGAVDSGVGSVGAAETSGAN
eukprot:92715-Pleurochrysis_carterae.AAC.1